MRNRVVLCDGRIRSADRFGWVDRDLVFGGCFARMSLPARSLYVFLCVAANRDGVSWYSDLRLREMVGVSQDELVNARLELVRLDLVAFESPYSQVLSLPLVKARVEPEGAVAVAASEAEVAQAMDEIRRKLWGGASC
jgi:hypothetical protein